MLLFINTEYNGCMSQVIVPSHRIYDIVRIGCRIIFNYDSGNLIPIEGTYQKKVETVTTIFETDDDAYKVLRRFYAACRDGSSVFYFG